VIFGLPEGKIGNILKALAWLLRAIRMKAKRLRGRNRPFSLMLLDSVSPRSRLA
jgi:hypothetical protein